MRRPAQGAHAPPRFRMPSCIGKPARYGIGAPVPGRPSRRPSRPPTAGGRFHDRTLAWFSAGEQRAREERAQWEATRPRRWRPDPILLAVAAAAFALGAIVTVALS